MQRHPALYPLSWGHHHGLRWALHLKREARKSSPRGLAALATRLEEFWTADLKAHFAAEEGLLLVRLGDTPDGTSARERTLKDHQELKSQLNQLRELSAAPDHKELTQALLEFAARLDHHISFEEHELFPLCEQTLDEAGLQEVGRALVEAGVGQGEPVLPETPP